MMFALVFLDGRRLMVEIMQNIVRSLQTMFGMWIIALLQQI